MQWLGCHNKLSCGHSDQRLSTLCSWPGKLHIHAFLFVLSSRPLSTFLSFALFLFFSLCGCYYSQVFTFFFIRYLISFISIAFFLFLRLALCPLSSRFIWSIFPFLLFSGFFLGPCLIPLYFRWISFCSFVSPFLLALQDSRCIYFPFSMVAFIFSFLSFPYLICLIDYVFFSASIRRNVWEVQ